MFNKQEIEIFWPKKNTTWGLRKHRLNFDPFDESTQWVSIFFDISIEFLKDLIIPQLRITNNQ